jgi:hypothetical protein
VRAGRIGRVIPALALVLASHAAAADRMLSAASDGHDAWLVVDRMRASGTEHVLLHHAAEMGCDCAHEAFVLPQVPEAMVAAGGALWMAMPRDAATGHRDVYSLEVARNPATGAFYTVPQGRMLIHPSLPGDGDLLGLALVEGRPIALRSGAPLEELRPAGWTPIAGAPAASGMRLAMADGAPALVDPAGAVLQRRVDGTWGSTGFVGPGAGFMRLVDGAARPSALVRADGDTRVVALLRPDGPPLRLAAFTAPDRASAVLGVGQRIGLFLPTGEGGAAVRWIDPMDGSLGAAAVLAAQPNDAGPWVLAAALGFAVIGVASGLLMRRALRLKSAAAERR